MAKKSTKKQVKSGPQQNYSATLPMMAFKFKAVVSKVLATMVYLASYRSLEQLTGDRKATGRQKFCRKLRWAMQHGFFDWNQVMLVTVTIKETGKTLRLNGDGTTSTMIAIPPGPFTPSLTLHHYNVNTMEEALQIFCRYDQGSPRHKSRRIKARLMTAEGGYLGAYERDVNLLQVALNIWLGRGVRDLEDDEIVELLKKGGKYYNIAQQIIGLFDKFRKDKLMTRFLRPAIAAAIFPCMVMFKRVGRTFWYDLFAGNVKPGSLAEQLRNRIILLVIPNDDGSSRKDMEIRSRQEAYRILVWYYEFIRTGAKVSQKDLDDVYLRDRPAGY